MAEKKNMRGNSAPSILSSDLVIVGDLLSKGDIQMDGKLEGNIRSYALTIGETAYVSGEIISEIVTIRGAVDGTIRARQIHLKAGSVINGDIYNETIAIEAGTSFNGSVHRRDDPLAEASISEENFSNVIKKSTQTQKGDTTNET